MILSFLGNQSWLISKDGENILIDPVLHFSFGSSKKIVFEINPQREIFIDEMPTPSAVILTTEHLQHFDPKSFQTLANKGCFPDVHVSNLFPSCALEVLDEMGFSVIRHEDDHSVEIGSFNIYFYSNTDVNLPWDLRVSSVYIKTESSAIVVQSDSALSNKLIEKVKSSTTQLLAIITTNNAIVTGNNRGAGLTNILPVKDANSVGPVGLKILIDSLIHSLKKMPLVSNIILCGGGYKDSAGIIGEPKWNQQMLASIANSLSLGTKVHAPIPGEYIDINFCNAWKNNSWVRLINNQKELHVEKTFWNMIPAVESTNSNLCDIDNELIQLARGVVMSNFGRSLLKVGSYLGRELGRERFVIQLISDTKTFDLVLNMSTVRFEKKEFSGDVALRNYPYGIRFYLNDFIALFTGEIQIWEVSMLSGRQWYISNKYSSPMAFLYQYFGESVKQNLAILNYKNILGLAR